MSSTLARADSQNPLVFFDLETTGLIQPDEPLPDITQIAAIYGDDDIFDKYVLPDKEITQGAQRVTGIRVEGDTLVRLGQPVPTVRLHVAMPDFLHWLADVSNRARQKPILLAYNAKRFDVPILLDAFRKCGLESNAKEAVAGYADPLEMARKLIPKDEAGGYSLDTLTKKYCQIPHDAHNAVGDCTALKELYHTRLQEADLSSYIFKP